jgi:hypothetical protein
MAAIPSRLASPFLRRAQLPERTIGTNFPDRGKRNCQSRLQPCHRRENIRLFLAEAEQILPSPHLTATLIPGTNVQDAEAEKLRRIEFSTALGRTAVTARRTRRSATATRCTRPTTPATGSASTTPRGTAITTTRTAAAIPRPVRPLAVFRVPTAVLLIPFVPILVLPVPVFALFAPSLGPSPIVQLVPVLPRRCFGPWSRLDSPRFFPAFGSRKSRAVRRCTRRRLPSFHCQICVNIFWIVTDKLLRAYLRGRRRGTIFGRSRSGGTARRNIPRCRFPWILANFCFRMTIRRRGMTAVNSRRCSCGSRGSAVCQIRSIGIFSIGSTIGRTRAATHAPAPVRLQ